jgi:hypothetical protein
MISLIKILEGVSNVDKFTFKQRDAGGVSVPYQSIKLVKQGEAKGYQKHNVILSGKFSGIIYSGKNRFIANGGESNNTFPPKSFKSLKDAIDYICGNANPNYNTNIPLDGMDTSFGSTGMYN